MFGAEACCVSLEHVNDICFAAWACFYILSLEPSVSQLYVLQSSGHDNEDLAFDNQWPDRKISELSI